MDDQKQPLRLTPPPSLSFSTLPPLPSGGGSARGPSRSGLRRLSRRFVCCTLLSLLLIWCFEWPLAELVGEILWLTGWGMGATAQEMIGQLFSAATMLAAILLPYLLFARMSGFPLRSIPRRRPHPPVLLASMGISMGAALLGMALSMAAAIFFSALGLRPAELSLEMPQNPFVLVLFFINMVVLPAVCEELIYRGIILHALRPFGDGAALFLSALFFGLMHRNMTQFPYAFVLGLAIGYFVLQTGSIYTGIFIHFTNNLIAVICSICIEWFQYSWQVVLLNLAQFLLYLAALAAGLLYLSLTRRVRWRLPPAPRGLPPARAVGVFLGNLPMVLLLVIFAAAFLQSFA